MPVNSETYDIAVIGGGMAGLASAIEAASGGGRVLLCDARTTLGGRARTQDRDGYRLNEGAHAIYEGGAAMAFLKELGVEPRGGNPDPSSGVAVDGEVLDRFPAGPASLMRSSVLKGGRVSMAKVFARLPRIDPAAYSSMTVSETIESLVGTGPAASFLHAVFRLSTYGNDPNAASGDAGLMQLKAANDSGVRYLDWGWSVMAESLEKIARDRGVEVRANAKVDAVEPTTDGYTLRIGAEAVAASRVVVAGTPALAGQLLGTFVPEAAGWVQHARPSTVASLDVGLRRGWGDRPKFALGIDEPTYLSVHAPVADLAPEGHTLVHVMRYHRTGEDLDSDRDRDVSERLLDRIQPGWRDDADLVHFSPRLVAATDVAQAERGGLAGRPRVERPGHERTLAIAGDWVGAEGVLVDASVASGRAAGRAVR